MNADELAELLKAVMGERRTLVVHPEDRAELVGGLMMSDLLSYFHVTESKAVPRGRAIVFPPEREL